MAVSKKTKQKKPKAALKKKSVPKKLPKKKVIQVPTKKIHKPEIMGLDDHKKSSKLPATSTALVSTDAFTQYMNEIRKYPLLTPEEERQLAIRYFEKGDKLAAEKLVTSNLRFVVKIALEYAKMGAKLMDVVQEGNVGLMHAVKEYNPYKGVKLITYAVWWIRGYIREYLMKQFSMVKIGTTQNQKKLYYNLQNEKRKLEHEGLTSSPALLSTRLGVTEKDVELMEQRMGGRDLSLDMPLDGEDGSSGAHWLDMQSDGSGNPESELEVLELIDLLKEKIEEIKPKLNEKELAILEHRVLADEPQTLQEIGDRFGITRERARQLEERLLKNLKENFLAIAHKNVEEKMKG